jgi:diadenosine tetraphosphate (Ap4A) HIT family hydrolase
VNVDCIFCRVIAGELPASIVYEDDRAVAFLDIFPVHAGHTLIVPRDHSFDLRDCPPDLAAHLFTIGHRLAPAIVAATDADGFNIWTAAGPAAGQTVFHLHLHVLPRFAGDGFGPRLPKVPLRESSRITLDEMAARIRAAS